MRFTSAIAMLLFCRSSAVADEGKIAGADGVAPLVPAFCGDGNKLNLRDSR